MVGVNEKIVFPVLLSLILFLAFFEILQTGLRSTILKLERGGYWLQRLLNSQNQ
jgi:hypothetical protein